VRTTAERLLSGPRGRRLCVELLRRAPGGDVVHRSLFAAARRVEEARGDVVAGRVAILSAEGGPAAAEPVRPPPVLPPSLPLPEAVAAVDPAQAVSADALLPALSDTVASATGWQPPHGEDVALADPAVAAALLPVARAVVAHPATGWWSTPADPAQQCRTVLEDRSGTPVPGPTAGRLAAWRADVLAGEARAAAYRRRHGVGLGGSWWVTPALQGLLCTTRLLPDAGSPALWMTEDDLGGDRADLVPCAVDPGAGVLEVRGPEDWAALVAAHPLDVTASRAPDWWGSVDPRPGAWLLPDWAAVARAYDAVHVSVWAWLTTSGVSVPVALPDGATGSTTLAGWDPDATWWLTDVDRDEGEPRRWARDDERWHPAPPGPPTPGAEQGAVAGPGRLRGVGMPRGTGLRWWWSGSRGRPWRR
jgi:hypothetical protein